jgi:uncharacterized protein (TIGR02145 family)
MKKSSSLKLFLWLSILLVLIFHCMSAQVTDTIKIESGWNLLSLPVKIGDVSIRNKFPTATSDAFIFHDEYLHKDTIDTGVGFWLKFDSAETYIITGDAIHRDTINVNEGWNMIGSLTEILNVDMIKTEPQGIIVSDYFSYVPQSGYESSGLIKPGVGYWVKVNQSGSIILSAGPPCPGLPTVTYAGKAYNTVQIGSQCWLKENLDVGTMSYGGVNQSDNDTIEKYCYNGDKVNCNLYGGLYQWNEAMQYTTTPGARGICPPGWHIPTNPEFQILVDAISNDGNALKAVGQGSGEGAGTNTSGFSALIAGYRSSGLYFYGIGYYTHFWSSTESNDPIYAGSRLLNYNSNYISPMYNYYEKNSGFSVRCVMD